MLTIEKKAVPSKEAVLAGMQRAVEQVVEEAKRNDGTLVVVRDGKIVHVKARAL